MEDEETYLELYLDQCAAQDDLAPPGLPLLSPLAPYDVYISNSSNPEAVFNSHLEEVKETSGGFSSVDLSFLPDELTQENKDQTVIRRKHEIEENWKAQSQQSRLPLSSKQKAGLGLNSSGSANSRSLLPPGDADSVQLSLEKPDSLPLASITPMTPMTPVSECSEIVPQLQNIVSTANLACKLDLKKIALQAKNAEYNPKRFAAVIMRIREPRTTALIFSSGKMVCTGAKSEEQSRLAARKYARVVQKLGFPARFLDFKIQNMVGSCDVKFPIRLEGLVLTHQQFSSYEPELFPGLIYRMVKPRIVLLIFVSGKVVLTEPNDEPRVPGPAIPTSVTLKYCMFFQSNENGFDFVNKVTKDFLQTFPHLTLSNNPLGKVLSLFYSEFPATEFPPQSPSLGMMFISQSDGHYNLKERTGAKERSEIYEAFENIYPILKGFKKA